MCWRIRQGLAPCGEVSPMPVLILPGERQTRDYNFGEAAFRCLLGFSRFAMRTVRLSSPVAGVDPLAIERYLSGLGLRTLAGSLTLADLRLLTMDRPAICLIHQPGESESHWVVVRGVSRGRV